MTEWATEDDAMKVFGVSRVEHCASCQEDMHFGYPACEVELPDGRTAEVCCRVSHAISEIADQEDRNDT